MRISSSNKKLSTHWPYTAALIYLLVMLVRLLSPQFGLIDDGRSLSIANGEWDVSWDLQGGRSRLLKRVVLRSQPPGD